jgi:Ca2+-binding EF-hand superfamily protein
MLSDFRRKKLTRIFTFYDADRDGFISRADFERLAHNLCRSYGYPEGSAQYNGLLAHQLAAWEGMRRMSDRDNDNRISLEEHLAGYDQMLTAGGPAAIQRIAEAAVALADRDGDGKVSEAEAIKSQMAWAGGGVTEEQARASFKMTDSDGDGFATAEDMRRMVEQYYMSEDPQAPGNWLLGPLD